MKIKEGVSAVAFGNQEPRKSECLVEENRCFGSIDTAQVKFLRVSKILESTIGLTGTRGNFLEAMRIRGGCQII